VRKIEDFPYEINPLYFIFKMGDIPFSFLLHSSMFHPEWGRYSIGGWHPSRVFSSKGLEFWWDGERRSGDPFQFLSRIYRENSLPSFSPLPFIQGMVGYFAYDAGLILEDIPSLALDDLNLPDILLGFYENVIVWDHIEKKAWVIYREEREKEFLWELLSKEKWISPQGELGDFKSNFTKEGYMEAIRKAKKYIRQGDIYQVNLSQRFSITCSCSPLLYFLLLSRINPSFFSAYLNFPPLTVVSCSPERFLYLEKNVIQTRPIKGTRPRGRNKEEDEFFKRELEESEKDKAELVMIVDLERNDLGKISKKGTVRVKSLREIEAHPTVFHTVATIEGEVKEKLTPVDILRACFPGGSITGAPKIRAMQIIEELEPTRRSVYTGSIGYISFHGRMDFNIAIRTIIFKEGYAYFQVGGGIVADSSPEKEYQETLDKGLGIMRTFEVLKDEKNLVEREILSISGN